MKYRVPDRLSYVATEKFLDSLPAEFEIVPGGHVCVKWPEGLTREKLARAARDLHDIVAARGGELCNPAATRGRNILESLAAIAPERKRRMVDLYRAIDGRLIAWDCSCEVCDGSWRKVAGPIEIED